MLFAQLVDKVGQCYLIVVRILKGKIIVIGMGPNCGLTLKVEFALDFLFKSILYSDDMLDIVEDDEDFLSLPQTALDNAAEVANVICIDQRRQTS